MRYTIKKGDTLSDISHRYLGDPDRYHEIASANHIHDPDRIYPGTVIDIPDESGGWLGRLKRWLK